MIATLLAKNSDDERTTARSAGSRTLWAVAAIHSAFLVLVLLPVLLWLFATEHGLSERMMIGLVIGLVVMQGGVTALLIWSFRLLPGLRARDPDTL